MAITKPNRAQNNLEHLNWRKLFSVTSNHSMEYFPLQKSNSRVRVALPVEVLDEGE